MKTLGCVVTVTPWQQWRRKDEQHRTRSRRSRAALMREYGYQLSVSHGRSLSWNTYRWLFHWACAFGLSCVFHRLDVLHPVGWVYTSVGLLYPIPLVWCPNGYCYHRYFVSRVTVAMMELTHVCV